MGNKVDFNLSTRRGPDKLPAKEKRNHVVLVRLNDKELQQLDLHRAKVNMKRAAYVRCVAFSQLPKSIPAINETAWRELARSAANVNQIARILNQHGHIPFEDIRRELDTFRRKLRNVDGAFYEG